jgi:hypothetical protein
MICLLVSTPCATLSEMTRLRKTADQNVTSKKKARSTAVPNVAAVSRPVATDAQLEVGKNISEK